MKKILFTLLFIFLSASLSDADFKAIPKDLHDQGDVVFDYYEASSGSWSNTADNSTTGSLSIGENLTVDNGVLYVDSNLDRVGINNSTPSYDLDVVGDIKASGNLTGASLWGTLEDVTFSPTAITNAESVLTVQNLVGYAGLQKIASGNFTSNDVHMGADLSVANDITAVNDLYVGNALIFPNTDGVFPVTGDLSVSGFSSENSMYQCFNLDLDLSRTDGLGSSKEYLVGLEAPYNLYIKDAYFNLNLTPANTVTIDLFENVSDITATAMTVSSSNKFGSSVSVDNLVEKGNLILWKLTGVSDQTDLTGSGTGWIRFIRTAE